MSIPGLLLLVSVIVVCGLVVVDTLRVGAPPMPSSGPAREALVALLPDTPGLECWELGAGAGGLAVAVAEARPSWRLVAWEAGLVAFAALRLRLALFGPPNVEARFGSFLDAPADGPDVLTAYLLGPQMRAVETWLGPRQRPWTLLSVHFTLRDRSPAQTVRARDAHHTPVFRYDAPGSAP
jgi:hypothetical protein